MKNFKNIENVSPFDVAEFLQTGEDIAEYLNQVLADSDAGELAAALGYIAKAKGMAEIAKASGLTREALYKALRPDSQPRLDTIQRVCTALGVKLNVVPA